MARLQKKYIWDLITIIISCSLGSAYRMVRCMKNAVTCIEYRGGIMEKRYQVFVSSTYSDLIEERKEVTQAILECDCFPAGMELFPASNRKQWDVIKK